MAVLYAAGQQITTVDAMTMDQIRFAAKLTRLGELMRRVEDAKLCRG